MIGCGGLINFINMQSFLILLFYRKNPFIRVFLKYAQMQFCNLDSIIFAAFKFDKQSFSFYHFTKNVHKKSNNSTMNNSENAMSLNTLNSWSA